MSASIFSVRVDMCPVNSIINGIEEKGYVCPFDDLFQIVENHIAMGAGSHCATWIEETRVVELHVRQSPHYSKLINVRLLTEDIEQDIEPYGYIYPYDANAS